MRITDHQEILHLRSKSNLRWTGRGRKGKKPRDEREKWSGGTGDEECEEQVKGEENKKIDVRPTRAKIPLSDAPLRKICRIVPADWLQADPTRQSLSDEGPCRCVWEPADTIGSGLVSSLSLLGLLTGQPRWSRSPISDHVSCRSRWEEEWKWHLQRILLIERHFSRRQSYNGVAKKEKKHLQGRFEMSSLILLFFPSHLVHLCRCSSLTFCIQIEALTCTHTHTYGTDKTLRCKGEGNFRRKVSYIKIRFPRNSHSGV